jgi:phage tail sheath protein FI
MAPEYNVGLNLREQFDSPPTIEGVPVSIGGMIGRTRKGDMVKPIFCSSWEEFVRKCGSFYGGFDLPKHTRGFFVNEGKALWISRVLKEAIFAYLNTGAANAALTWTAKHSGLESNSIQIKFTDPGATNPLLITITYPVGGWLIDVQLATNAGVITSTANSILAAINAHLIAQQLVTVSLGTGSNGTGLMTAMVATNLATGSGPATADDWFYDSDKLGLAAKISAINPGAWGNAIKITTKKVSTTLAAIIVAGANTSAELDSIRDIEVGDLVIFDDGVNLNYIVVATVTAATKTITFKSKVLNGFAIGTPILTSTTHAVATTIKTALANGATQIDLNNATGARKGSLIHINNGTNEYTVEVTAVSGNTIYFAAVTGLGASITANSPATSFEFDISVSDDMGVSENHIQLSMNPNNSLNYINNRLSGKSNQSDLIEAIDQNPSNSPAYVNIPYPLADWALSSGLDGETPADADYMGDEAEKTGIYKFKGLKEVSMIATPGVLSKAVQENGHNFCDANIHAIYIGATPQSVETIEEAIEFRDYTLNGSTMRGTCYFPFITIWDPESDYSVKQDISAEGWVIGVWSRVRVSRGFHKAPANERIKGIIGLATDDKVIDWDDASLLLNPRGINIIRDLPGYGIRIFGARTLLQVGRPQQFIHVMGTTIYNEQSLLNASLWTVFEPNNADLVDNVIDMIKDFFYRQWKDGVFVPEDDSDRAYFAQVVQQGSGIFEVKLGFNVVDTAEKVIFTFTNMNSQNTIEER